ncbi:type III PLP-dependent enzyme [Nonomuraea sp. NPDC049784]|uniref:type III PLP-dependent enzyme n=1 Tax=Nonomuraea sp. NPDC049784 TaxID=3154361 RepID=UPI0033E09BAD
MRQQLLDHLRALAEQDLPAYVYDLAALREHTRTIRAALPDTVEIFYAAKANSDPRLLAVLRDHLDGFEVASAGELAHVRALFPDIPIAFGGPGKTAVELARALDADLHRLHVESVHELRLLSSLLGRRTVEILLRVNLAHPLEPAALLMGGVPSPFGMDPADLEDCLHLIAAQPQIRLRGLHLHLASGLEAPSQLTLADHILSWARQWAATRRRPLAEINIGGGMGVDYHHPDRLFDWQTFGAGLDKIQAEHPGTRLRIEPGRSISAYCGYYLTRVLDLKRSHGEVFAVVAGGTHHLRTPAARQHDQPFHVIPDDHWPWHWTRPGAANEPVTLVGQLCTPKDVLARRVPVERLHVGDLLAFTMTGAYAWNISHHDFLMHPAPRFHYLDESATPHRCPQ